MKKLIALIAIFGMITSISVTASAGQYRPGTRDDDIRFWVDMYKMGAEGAEEAIRKELQSGGVSESVAREVEAMLEATPEPTAAPTPEATPEPTAAPTPEALQDVSKELQDMGVSEGVAQKIEDIVDETNKEIKELIEQDKESQTTMEPTATPTPGITDIPDISTKPLTREDFATDEDYEWYTNLPAEKLTREDFATDEDYEWYLEWEKKELEIIAEENADFPEKLAKWEADAKAVKALRICAIVFGCIAILSFVIGIFAKKNNSFSKNNAKKILFCIAAFSVLAAVILWAIGFDKEKKMGHKPYLVTDEHVIGTWETGEYTFLPNGERVDRWYVWGMDE